MAEIIVFSERGYSGISKEYRSNDPNLVMNGDDFIFQSAIVLSDDGNAYDEVDYGGNSISLNETDGPNDDGGYKDPADWEGTDPFHIKSLQIS